ncbi:DUF6328 family protein [Bradyrhizobium sp. TZ2]
MTPAALHRLAFHGEDDPQFFEIGSRLVVAAGCRGLSGISGDNAVVGYKITKSGWVSFTLAGAAAIVFLAAWYVYPLLSRRRGPLRRR